MPKVKSSPDEWIRYHKELQYEYGKIICRVCAKQINADKKYNFVQHIKTKVHIDNLEKQSRTKATQLTISENPVPVLPLL